MELKRYTEAKRLALKTLPVARRVLGDCNEFTLMIRMNYAMALCKNPAATLDDIREAETTIAETERTARRVFGAAHPLVGKMEADLRTARGVLRAGEALSGGLNEVEDA
jgi:hypothetical protein